MGRKTVSIVTACYNEEGNITELHQRLTKVMSALPQYDYEIIIIDNKSTDGTRKEIREICDRDPKFKAIFNVRNFGHIRSPWHAFLQGHGDCVIFLCSDLEDPPELIPSMLEKWEEGYKLAMAVRERTDETGIYPFLRKIYYKLLNYASNVEQVTGLTGFGLYDKAVMDAFRAIDDPYPYTRGLIAELGWEIARIPFQKPVRPRGLTKSNLPIYLDMALLAMVSHSRLPIRLATVAGAGISALSCLVAMYYLVRKLIWWDEFQAGVAPALIGLFFLMGLLFLFMGLLGEYIGLLVTHVVRRPLVVEELRINFAKDASPPE